MKVYRSGRIFKSARMTGPTKHFLSVEFDKAEGGIEFVIAETQKIVSDKKAITSLKRSIKACANKLPVQGIFSVRRIFISQNDEPNEEAYVSLLSEIIAFAEIELKT